jgi:excisionase family DNA binding protein
METTDDLLSIAEAAKRLGVGKYTIRRLIRSGELRAFRIRTVLRISPFDLRRYLARQEERPRALTSLQ